MASEIQKLYKPAMKCRIYMWQLELLYFGPIRALDSVLYSAPVLLIALDGSFNLRIGKGQWKKCVCVILPAGIAHEIQPTQGVIVKYWVEKESFHYSLFQEQFYSSAQQFTFQINREKIIAVFQSIYEDMLTNDAARTKLDYLFSIHKNIKVALDSRVSNISKIIRDEPDCNFSIESLAFRVDLSPSRLLHLIKQETGTSYRRFRMWQRVRYAIANFGEARSLTYASVEAGFNDSAHFSRCFKSIYGATPSSVHKTLELYEVKSW